MDGIRMILVGPNAGKDITLHGFDFKGGTLVLPPRGSAAAQRILTRYYSAYPAGSLEGERAQADWERSQSTQHGYSQREAPVPADAHNPFAAREKELSAALEEARRGVERRIEEERAEAERQRADDQAELARLRAEVRTEREAKKAAEVKLADAWKSSPPMPTTEEPPAPKGKAKAKAE